MFKAYYDYNRFRYIHSSFKNSDRFDCSNATIIPKTACFFSNDLDVYIDTSDGVNDDLQIQEYCGRILSCIRISRGKKFLFFKSTYSPLWSKNIKKIAEENNGSVVPFFKWSFNNDFYFYTMRHLSELRQKINRTIPIIDVGLFADFNKSYQYPLPSMNDPRVSCNDIEKFGLQDMFGREQSSKISDERYAIHTREKILSCIQQSRFSTFHGAMPYPDYIHKSMECRAVLNPPGIGEYTSRLFDQTAIGNLIILRKNSYDQGLSWKDYIPSVDFKDLRWEDDLRLILDNRDLWREKGRYYFENRWSPSAIFGFFIDKISEAL